MGAWRFFFNRFLCRPSRVRKLMADPRRLGQLGEWLAYEHLLAAGYDVLARDWHAPFGEVDLIAWKDGQLHFIEVKTRQAGDEFRPEDAVTGEKQQRYYSLAAYFLKEHQLRDISVRYHIVSIEVEPAGTYRLEFLKNAF